MLPRLALRSREVKASAVQAAHRGYFNPNVRKILNSRQHTKNDGATEKYGGFIYITKLDGNIHAGH